MKKLLLVSAFVFGSLVFAAPPAPMSFSNFDTNKDGVISEEEFTGEQANHMAKMAEEGRPMKNAGNAPSFEMFDLDKDGKVTQEEFNKFQEEHKAKMMEERGPKGKGNGPKGMM